MGLKCSVLGHKYGDETVERDREEQGSEVVITIREIETCERCDAERVVSENKEVTSIATPDDPETGADDAAGAGTDEADAESASGDDAATSEDAAVEADDAGPAGAGTAADDPGVDATEGAGTSADAPEPDEGAEILDAESEDPVDDELADPSVEEAEAAADADDPPVETDAVIMGEDDEAESDPRDGRAPGEWPEEPDDDEGDWAPEVGEDAHSITAPDAGTEANGAVTVPEGEFACPECGYTTPVEASSLRAGDFCPECRKGALLHRAEDAHEGE